MTRAVIAVDGIDGSGKSTFARRLRAALDELGTRAVIVSVDDFRCRVDWSSVVEAEAYYDAYYDFARCQSCLAAFVAGTPRIDVPVWDIASERVVGTKPVELAGASIAIVEGVMPLRVPHTAAGLVVYLDVSEAEARRRIVERDLAKGRTRGEIEHRIDHRYAPAQRRYHGAFDPRGRADVVIENAGVVRVTRSELSRLPAPLRDVVARALPR